MNDSLKKGKKQKIIFYSLLMFFPMVQFLIMYVGVNLDLILMAFREYSFIDGYSWVGFANINTVIDDVINNGLVIVSIKNSLIYFGMQIPFNIVLSILFSFYIFKKYFGDKFFRVMLFMPTIISSVVMVLLFKYFAESAVPSIVNKIFNIKIDGLLANAKTSFGAIVFYNILCGFGSNILLYTGAMSAIPDSIIEGAQVDGVTNIKELIFIVFPMIYSTIVTLFIANIAVIFTNQLNVYTLFGYSAESRNYTLGYFLFKGTTEAVKSEYPYYSAMGVLLTVVMGPIVLIVRKILLNFDPLSTVE